MVSTLLSNIVPDCKQKLNLISKAKISVTVSLAYDILCCVYKVKVVVVVVVVVLIVVVVVLVVVLVVRSGVEVLLAVRGGRNCLRR